MHKTPSQIIIILCRLLLVAGLIFGGVRLYSELDLLPEDLPSDTNAENMDVVFTEDTPETDKLSFEEYCRRNPVSTCWNNRQTTDFLYDDEDAPIAVVKSEEFAPALLEEAISGRKPDDPEPEPEPEKLEQLYEEDLPEDIIEGRGVTNPKLIGKTIIPEHKPPYFGERPVLAVVIDDMGISQKRTADIASLQAPLTVSFLTYGRKLAEQVANSRRAGQEVMIHVPMEAQKAVDTAPDVLTTQMSPEQIQDNLKIMLAKFENVRGINNHMGSKLTEDKMRMTAVMQVLKEQGMFFLDSKTSPKSEAENAARESGIAYAHRHVFIDNNNDKNYILGQLAKAENVARKNGYAVAIGHPKTQTYAALKEWLPELEGKGLVLVPLSQIVEVLNPGFGK